MKCIHILTVGKNKGNICNKLTTEYDTEGDYCRTHFLQHYCSFNKNQPPCRNPIKRGGIGSVCNDCKPMYDDKMKKRREIAMMYVKVFNSDIN